MSIDQPPPIDHLSTRDGYDRWATIYDQDDNPLVAIEEPHVDRLLGDVRWVTLADIGCGTGRHSVRLAQRGARVTGIDFSSEMLARAQAKPGAEGIRFVQHDLAHRLPLEDRSFDRVVCGLVLDHIPDLETLFREMGRICKGDGSIVVSNMHPAMMLRGVQARFTDPATGRETRPQSCPHQISDYVVAATRAGLTIDAMSEHVIDESIVARSPRAAKYLGWPILLMMRLVPRPPDSGQKP